MKLELAALLAGSAALASAQQSMWGQCGGIGWTGPTNCVPGAACSTLNPYYAQCLSGGPTAATTTASRTTTTSSRTTTTTSRTTTTTSRSTTTSSRTTTTSSRTTTTTSRTTTPSASPTSNGKFQYVGVNESGAEFGQNSIPGRLGTDYTWPSPSSVDYFVSQGMNIFRVCTMMERISPPSTGLTGNFDSAYISGLDTIVNYITNKGAYAVIDPHNYGRYNGNIITDTNAFKAWWVKIANRYKSNSRVIFDTNNEYNTMDQTLVVNLNQAAIDGIRSTGATNTIFVEGNAWTGAWSWTSSGNSNTMINLVDPGNNLVYEMHQYLDSDSSGTSETCVSATILKERITAATNWCQSNGKKCILGEVGAGNNAQCQQAVKDGLTYAQQSGAWLGVLWWAAGPWWGTYFQSIEPPSGAAVSAYVPILKSFAP
ncbi:Endoglucanase [Orbilia brochopaga]|nr:Endoglucanase [Drechslerella brochopaga]